jgi:hypothetical protein
MFSEGALARSLPRSLTDRQSRFRSVELRRDPPVFLVRMTLQKLDYSVDIELCRQLRKLYCAAGVFHGYVKEVAEGEGEERAAEASWSGTSPSRREEVVHGYGSCCRFISTIEACLLGANTQCRSCVRSYCCH